MLPDVDGVPGDPEEGSGFVRLDPIDKEELIEKSILWRASAEPELDFGPVKKSWDRGDGSDDLLRELVNVLAAPRALSK